MCTDVKTMDLFRDILSCQAHECWGERNPEFYKPIVLPCKRQHPKVMIVTEQPNIEGRGTFDPKWEPTNEFLEEIRLTKRGEPTRGIIRPIDEMFEGRFLKDFDEKKSKFDEFYLTAYIKCSGNFRNKRKFSRKELDVCANKWLREEMRSLRPRLIVTFGAHASTFVLSEINYKNKWTDRVWEQFKWIIKGIQVPYVETDYLRFKLIVALHPSGQNWLANPFNKRIQTLVLNCLGEF